MSCYSSRVYKLETRVLKKNSYVMLNVPISYTFGKYMGEFDARFKLFKIKVNNKIKWLDKSQFSIIGVQLDYFYDKS